MSIASEFWRSTIALVEDRIQKQAPFRAKVKNVASGLVKIQTYDSATPMEEQYAQLAGATVSVNDDVVVIDVNGKPLILGKVRSGSTNLTKFDGAVQIQPLSNTNGTFVIRDSGGGNILIIDTPSGNASLKGTMAIDGVTANKASLTAPRFQAWSSATSTVTSTTNTTTYQTAMTRSFTLPEGTWSVYVVAGQQLRHSADGGIAFRTNIGTSVGSGIVTGFYSTNYVQGISTHQVSGQTGTINIAVEYRCSSVGTSTSKTPWMYMCAVRTA